MPNSKTLIVFLTLLLFGCQNANREGSAPSNSGADNNASPAPQTERSENAPAASVPADASVFSSAVSNVQSIDTAKQLIRTAELKFRAPKVLDAALQVERIAQQFGGFVLQNDYKENASQPYSRRVSKDSAEQTTIFFPTSHVLIRVPYRQLDTTLRSIGKLAEVLDYRNLEAKDVSLDIMEQQLAAIGNRQYGEAVSGDIAEKGDRLKDITAARERQFDAKRGEDIAKIERLRIEDQVRYSTVTVDIYELARRRTEMIYFEESGKSAWRPGLLTRIGSGLSTGWYLLIDLIVGLVTIWPFLLIVLAVIWFVRRKK